MKKYIFVIILIIIFSDIFYCKALSIKLKKVFEVGNKKTLFGNIKSVAEDLQGNLYIPDSKAFKIYKFSPEGKLILKFGRKGKGPGDFYRLDHIAISEKNELLITDGMFFSVYTTEGKELKKVNIWKSGALLTFSLKSSGSDYLVGRKLASRNLPPPLVIIKVIPTVKIINDNLLTCAPPKLFKEAGIFNKNITPDTWYSCYNGYSIVALSEKYFIKIIDKNGMVINTITRDIEGNLLSKKEREYLIRTEIEQWKTIDSSLKNGLKKTIPSNKTIIGGVALSNKHIFVERIKEDISNTKSLTPIDVYTIKGVFIGQIYLKSLPILATETFFYFMEESDDDIIITKYLYENYLATMPREN